jgi:hypothetical protein
MNGPKGATFEINQVVLCRWKDGSIYFSRIGLYNEDFALTFEERIHRKEQKALVRFEDKSTAWVPLADVHLRKTTFLTV